ncbi:YifB family Mg chelatase-like AAA ATPase [Sulfurimonas sp. HSL-1716]|uniref:YifB family Mg chelatase-like AAA ATPase n=1 Tax=Hydrocurvibacter sulfurireducens TaxID=3131937 RepID=UPI0031F82AEA
MKQVNCATYEGIEAKVVQVESSLTKGLPSFNIVGIASTSINESKERVKSALLSNGFSFPPKRFIINLSPSDLKKEGSHFDLSIALLLLMDDQETDISDWFVFGELGLDGQIKENKYLYPLILSLANQNLIKKAIVPKESLKKLTKIAKVEFYGAAHIKDALNLLKSDDHTILPSPSTAIEYDFISAQEKLYYLNEYRYDFKDVKGQKIAKRAALIAAAGFHNIILEGSPGCGKSMIAQRLRYILPPMNSADILEVAKLQALDGCEPDFKPIRPFRSPHHTSTQASIFGGGSYTAKIGEVGLSHSGILFFDELPHYSKNILEALREPLQDDKIRISRVNSKVQYPAAFLFVAAMNPCPCGNLLNPAKECRCNELDIKKYKNRLSDPFLDRIDIAVTMQNISAADRSDVTSKQLHEKVLQTTEFISKRGQNSFNGKLSDEEIERFCVLNDEAKDILDNAVLRFSLSFRAIKKVQKVARTIADLEQRELIGKKDILEALSYRRR